MHYVCALALQKAKPKIRCEAVTPLYCMYIYVICIFPFHYMDAGFFAIVLSAQ